MLTFSFVPMSGQGGEGGGGCAFDRALFRRELGSVGSRPETDDAEGGGG